MIFLDKFVLSKSCWSGSPQIQASSSSCDILSSAIPLHLEERCHPAPSDIWLQKSLTDYWNVNPLGPSSPPTSYTSNPSFLLRQFPPRPSPSIPSLPLRRNFTCHDEKLSTRCRRERCEFVLFFGETSTYT